MKPIYVWWAFALLALNLEAVEGPKESPPQPRQYVIGISPYLEKSAKDPVFRSVVRLMIEELPLESSLTVFDAFEMRSVARVSVPNARAFTSPKTRANQFAGAVQSLRRFLAEEHSRPANGHLNFESAIRLPQFCDFLAETLTATNAPLNVLLIGSPLYQDAKEPGFSMIDGYFPSDGHLRAGREKSVFGTEGDEASARGWMVHWVYFGDPWLNDLHREKVTRFWDLYLERRGARLGTFSSDLPTALDHFSKGEAGEEARAAQWKIDPGQSKIEMLRVSRNVELTDWITREALPEAASGPPERLVGPMKIGIRWKPNIDLDLYAAPERGAQTLYFEHTRSPEGYYYKDHRSSPGREFEFIEFETPVDARKVEASVNFFQGSCPGGARGEVRIEFDGRIYSASFAVRASTGNEGRTGHRQEQFWTRIPVQEILKIAER